MDVTAAAGLLEQDGRGLGIVAADVDGDRRIDLFVANDSTANFFVPETWGDSGSRKSVTRREFAANAAGGYQAGMGVACGDLDGDGRVDLAVTNFYGESTTLFLNLGQGFASLTIRRLPVWRRRADTDLVSARRFWTQTTMAGLTS